MIKIPFHLSFHLQCSIYYVFNVAGQLCTMYLICLTLIYKNKFYSLTTLCIYQFGIYWGQGNRRAGESNYSFSFLNSKTFMVWASHSLLLIKVWYGSEAVPNLLYVGPKQTSEYVFRCYYQLLTDDIVWSIWKKCYFFTREVETKTFYKSQLCFTFYINVNYRL